MRGVAFMTRMAAAWAARDHPAVVSHWLSIVAAVYCGVDKMICPALVQHMLAVREGEAAADRPYIPPQVGIQPQDPVSALLACMYGSDMCWRDERRTWQEQQQGQRRRQKRQQVQQQQQQQQGILQWGTCWLGAAVAAAEALRLLMLVPMVLKFSLIPPDNGRFGRICLMPYHCGLQKICS
jgi:hypothetical protein